jgi:hypothetical protein
MVWLQAEIRPLLKCHWVGPISTRSLSSSDPSGFKARPRRLLGSILRFDDVIEKGDIMMTLFLFFIYRLIN